MSERYDLHTHTLYSDGSLSPEELLGQAKEIGLSGISITDHDTIEAYANLPKTDLKIGIGIEFSCHHKNESVHILGYDFLLDDPGMTALCLRHKNRRYQRNLQILKNLKHLGMPISEEELYQLGDSKTIGRPHIAKILVDKGFIPSIEVGFSQYLAEGRPAFAQGEMISVEETIQVIHHASGKAFIAHPHLIKRSKLVRELFEMPFDGIEAYYARFSPSDHEKWIHKALQKGWLISGGSDFHGDLKTFNKLGSSWVDENQFQKIFSRPL